MTMKMEERRKRISRRLEMYYECEEKILQGQSYTIGSRSLTRTNLSEVRAMISKLEAELNALDARGTTKRAVKRIIPMG